MIFKSASKTTLDPEIDAYLKKHPQLLLREETLSKNGASIRNSPVSQATHQRSFRGPHGTINLRVLYPSNPHSNAQNLTPALIYFHGGGYTVGAGDDFENGAGSWLRRPGCSCICPSTGSRLSGSIQHNLDEYEAVLDWLKGDGGKQRGVDPDLVFGGGDSAGGNMTAALTLRLRVEGRKPMAGIFLLYPEPMLLFGTSAATENNLGPYLNCNGIFEFTRNYIPSGVSPSTLYISPGQHPASSLKGLPPAAKPQLEGAGNQVAWHHYETLCHGFLQIAPWSSSATKALLQVAQDVGEAVERARN
ncbi:Alpha/Beta hydrolase protein [Aspergillus desertorum]